MQRPNHLGRRSSKNASPKNAPIGRQEERGEIASDEKHIGRYSHIALSQFQAPYTNPPPVHGWTTACKGRMREKRKGNEIVGITSRGRVSKVDSEHCHLLRKPRRSRELVGGIGNHEQHFRSLNFPQAWNYAIGPYQTFRDC